VAAAALVTWLALPTVWWSPLNVDEELTLRISDFSFAHVFHIVSTERGGGPLHFWLEHFLLGWWPGLPALRVPSLIFFCLALPAVALLGRRLLGPRLGSEGGAGVVLLTAVAPIPVLYATFGRPHTLLFAWLMWSTVLALKAADGGSRRLWIAAGALLGLTVFIHPTAPLYALTAFGVALVYAPHPPRAVVRQAWLGAVALLVTFAPYYVRTLHVLGDRYGVGSGATSGRTFSGRPVWEDALHFVAPGRHDVNYFTVLAAVGVVSLIVRRAYRTLAVCTLTVAAPVVFFSVVPANGDSALFFDRYMIPVTPAFFVVVLAGCLAIAGWAGALRIVVLALLVGGLAGVEFRYDLHHRNAVERIKVDSVVRAVERAPRGSVLFGSTGTSGALFSSFDYGHPANILDHLVALRVHSVELVDDDSCERALPFLNGGDARRFGIWLFYAASPAEARTAARALGRVTGTRAAQVGRHYFVVETVSPLRSRALIELGVSLRSAWKRSVPSNRRVDELLLADRQLLGTACVPYGELGDPDISPHWPPVTTKHQ
jgi:Dolichyl-phosphate-mannose-protein mannosyltransferase